MTATSVYVTNLVYMMVFFQNSSIYQFGKIKYTHSFNNDNAINYYIYNMTINDIISAHNTLWEQTDAMTVSNQSLKIIVCILNSKFHLIYEYQILLYFKIKKRKFQGIKILLEKITQYMNINIKFVEISINETNIENIYMSLLLGEYDFAITYASAGFRHTTLPPLYFTKYRLYMTHTKSYSVSSQYFIELFQPKLWIAVLLIYLTLLGFLVIYKYCYSLKFNQFVESVFHIIGLSNEQINFSTISLSICLIIFSMFFYLLEWYFGAFLYSKLSAKFDTNLPFERIEDLAIQMKYKICAQPVTNVEKSLSNDIIYDRILNHPECNKTIKSLFSTDGLSTFKSLCENPDLTLVMPSKF